MPAVALVTTRAAINGNNRRADGTTQTFTLGGANVVQIDQSLFSRSALASGLLTREELDEAWEALRQEKGKSPTDEQLARKLVELGQINAWQSQQLLEGRTKFNLGPYQVMDSIGQGGMGQVFKAEHTIMGRVVAVKVLPRGKSTPEAIASFSREIRNQAQLQHPNLVHAYDAGHDGNVHFLVTEYVPGTDLRKFVRRRGRLSMEAAASIIAQAADGLEHAHSQGLIHRDVKPGNLLVTPQGHVKLSDLGLAACTGQDSPHLARPDKVVGTADYLAPEQILDPTSVGPVTDVYSLGCTLYYAVTGKVPFPGGTTSDKARAHCNTEPLNPKRLNPELTDDFVAVIAAMMAKKPEDRLQSATEVALRLSPWADQAAVVEPAGADLADAHDESHDSAPVLRSPLRRAVPPAEADTEPNFLVQPEDESGPVESPSQGQADTAPVNSAKEETVPDFDGEQPATERLRERDIPWLIILVVFIGSMAALGTLTAIMLRLFN